MGQPHEMSSSRRCSRRCSAGAKFYTSVLQPPRNSKFKLCDKDQIGKPKTTKDLALAEEDIPDGDADDPELRSDLEVRETGVRSLIWGDLYNHRDHRWDPSNPKTSSRPLRASIAPQTGPKSMQRWFEGLSIL